VPQLQGAEQILRMARPLLPRSSPYHNLSNYLEKKSPAAKVKHTAFRRTKCFSSLLMIAPFSVVSTSGHFHFGSFQFPVVSISIHFRAFQFASLGFTLLFLSLSGQFYFRSFPFTVNTISNYLLFR